MLQELLDKNSKWASAQLDEDENYFRKLAEGQSPEIMLVGCCDSRFPFEVITDSVPGEIFVHRNIANQVNPQDENIMSAVEFAVKVLEVKHIVVCGHYECGGVKASIDRVDLAHVNNHIDPIIKLHDDNANEIDTLHEGERFRKMVELNVEQQCRNLSDLDFIVDAGEYPHIHGWVFDLNTGLINNLEINKYV